MWSAARAFCAPLLLVTGLLLLTSCGGGNSAEAGLNKAGPPGLFTDATLTDYLMTGFDEAKLCTGLQGGTFEELTVVMMEPQFPCRWYADGCSGEFVAPNTVKLGTPYVWKHEVLHYLLFVNTGQADPEHTHNSFWNCV